MTREKIDLTSRKALALEAGTVALAAWMCRSRFLSKDDKPDDPQRPPTPLGETIDGDQVYVINPGDGSFEFGAEDQEGNFISVSGTREQPTEADDPRINIDLMSDEDIDKLELLKARMQELYVRWAKRHDAI